MTAITTIPVYWKARGGYEGYVFEWYIAAELRKGMIDHDQEDT